jgi:hypothetical protein
MRASQKNTKSRRESSRPQSTAWQTVDDAVKTRACRLEKWPRRVAGESERNSEGFGEKLSLCF